MTMLSDGTRMIPLGDLGTAHARIQEELSEAINSVMASSAFVLGAEVEAFENEWASACGVGHGVGCGNGTDALELALWAVGVQAGDEVITVANTFAATGEAIVRCGAIPRFVDVTPDTLLMDLDAAEAAITPKTRAIVPVHLYGSCVDMPRLMAMARRHDLLVVEDSAQAHLATVGDRRAGSFGHAGSFSFYPGKNLGAIGDAGAVVTDDANIAGRLRRGRDHGRVGKYEHTIIGRNSRMDGIQGAVLRVKLRHLEDWTRRRREIASTYRGALAGIDGISAVSEPAGATGVYHLFVVEVDGREEFRAALAAQGVSTGIHYPIPLHRQEAFKSILSQPPSLPVTELAAERIVTLPLYAEMSEEDIAQVVSALATAGAARRVA